MKKYSLMLALASLMLGSSSLYAAEALNPTAVFSSSELSASNSFTGITGANGLTITMVLNADAIEAIAKAGVLADAKPQVFSISSTAGGTAHIGFGINYSSAGDPKTITSSGWWGNWSSQPTSAAIANGTNSAGSVTTQMNSALSSLDWDSLTGLALTYTYSDTNVRVNNLYMTALYSDGTFGETFGYASGGKYSGRTWGTLGLATDYVTSVTIYSGEATETEAQDLNHAVLASASVPEPATATLSLLALAGLAARRRRH